MLSLLANGAKKNSSQNQKNDIENIKSTNINSRKVTINCFLVTTIFRGNIRIKKIERMKEVVWMKIVLQSDKKREKFHQFFPITKIKRGKKFKTI